MGKRHAVARAHGLPIGLRFTRVASPVGAGGSCRVGLPSLADPWLDARGVTRAASRASGGEQARMERGREEERGESCMSGGFQFSSKAPDRAQGGAGKGGGKCWR
nr:hypothetical protein CFP56_21904 [Quercus suber]